MMFKKGFFKDLFKGKDDKPLLVSFILQQDDCSRLLGEFGEKHLPGCTKLVIAWQNGTGDTNVVHSASLTREDAVHMLIKGTMLLEGCYHGK